MTAPDLAGRRIQWCRWLGTILSGTIDSPLVVRWDDGVVSTTAGRWPETKQAHLLPED